MEPPLWVGRAHRTAAPFIGAVSLPVVSMPRGVGLSPRVSCAGDNARGFVLELCPPCWPGTLQLTHPYLFPAGVGRSGSAFSLSHGTTGSSQTEGAAPGKLAWFDAGALTRLPRPLPALRCRWAPPHPAALQGLGEHSVLGPSGRGPREGVVGVPLTVAAGASTGDSHAANITPAPCP